ncbi:hypothetical protein [Thermoanaerobacterium sp. DL9XJH110]|uniref:hypothetical protein n=1 Tax=Thermoanaerobacterium sp. DL9XJH110 TaxID=3386643 RepID=UPI003BB7BE15
MPVVELPVRVDKELVLKYLGCGGKRRFSSRILEEIDGASARAEEFMHPAVCYDFFNFFADERQKKVFLPGGKFFSGEYIVKSLIETDCVVAAVATLGRGVDEEISRCFDRGDFLRGIILDAAANAALNRLVEDFKAHLLRSAAFKNRGLTRCLSPGRGDWDIGDQEAIFSLLDAEAIGVTLNENRMMSPAKSLTVVFGTGENVGVPHDVLCSGCDMKMCNYR